MALDARILDTSIISRGVRESKIDLATPMNMFTSLRADKRAQNLADLTLSTAEKRAQKQLQIKEITQGSLNPNGTINGEKLIMGLNRAGHTKEAFGVETRMETARKNQDLRTEAANKQKATMMKNMGMAALTVSKSEKPIESFIEWQKDARKNNWGGSKDVINYNVTQEEIESGELNPKILSYMGYVGEKVLSPSDRLARSKDRFAMAKFAEKATEKPTSEFGLKPIYGKKDGKTVAFQLSKSGGLKEIELPAGVELSPGVTYQNLGDKIGIYDKSGTLVTTLDKGIAPEKRADLRFKDIDANIKLAEEERDAEAFEAKRIEIAKKAVSYKKANQGAIDSIEEFIDKAEGVFESPDLSGVTGIKSVFRYIPGSDYADLDSDLQYLVSSGVINTMRDLKEKSPTGSTGFGALSEKEMGVLENAFSTLSNRKQSPSKMKGELGRIIKKMKKALREQRAIFRNSNSLLGEEKTIDQTIDDEIEGL